jgi:hypothetical protein
VAALAGASATEVNGYSAYIIGSDGRIEGRIDLCCVDDDEAKEHAKALVNGHDVELWYLDRRIATFTAQHQ